MYDSRTWAPEVMRPLLFALTLASNTLLSMHTDAQIPALPEGANTLWIVDQPQEVVGWALFDPATIEDMLPPTLRFTTVGELASGGISWATDYLSIYPAREKWGISFLEIVRMQTFTIDGHAPAWPQHGAIGLWFARVAPADPDTDLGPGQPFLSLEFWIPDSMYVADIRAKGHYASYGNVALSKNNQGTWQGNIDVHGLKVVVECKPTGPIAGGEGTAGMQAIYPPQSSPVKSVVRIAFAGHRIQQCRGDSLWSLQGSHPLTKSVILNPSEFQFGYELQGGAYEP